MKLLVLLSSVAILANAYRLQEKRELSEYNCGEGNNEFIVPVNPNSGVITLTSTNYNEGGNYPLNQTCNFLLTTGPEATEITIVVVFFEVENGFGCPWDSFCVFSQPYCGDIPSNEVLGKATIPAHETSTVSFNSDYIITRRGIKILVQMSPAREDNVITEDGCATGNLLPAKNTYDFLPSTSWEPYTESSSSGYFSQDPPCNNPTDFPDNSGEYYETYDSSSSSYEYFGGYDPSTYDQSTSSSDDFSSEEYYAAG